MGFHTGPFRQSGKFGNQFGFGNKFGFGNTFGFGRFGNGFGFAGLDPYYAAYGYGFDPFFDPFYANYASLGNHDDYQQPAQPSVVVMMPQVQMPPPPVIMPPIRPEIRDYNWPVSSPDSAAAFTLVRKDQRVDSAIAVTVEGNVISYITPDGLHRQMNMDTLDREKTRQRNATKRLRMPWLAGGQE
jgi:hypothetical protein